MPRGSTKKILCQVRPIDKLNFLSSLPKEFTYCFKLERFRKKSTGRFVPRNNATGYTIRGIAHGSKFNGGPIRFGVVRRDSPNLIRKRTIRKSSTYILSCERLEWKIVHAIRKLFTPEKKE